MDLILIALCAPLAILILWFVWAFVTWYVADNQKMLAPWAEGRVRFVTVLVSGAEDFWKVSGLGAVYRAGRAVTVSLWGYWAPRLTDRSILAAIFTDLSIGAAGENTWTWIAQHPLVAIIVLGINLLAASPAHAPRRMTPPTDMSLA